LLDFLAPNKAIFRRLLLVIFVIAETSIGVGALERTQPLGQLYHTAWNARNRLHGRVAALAQTTDGFLWVGTSDGLYRFDGVFLEEFKPEVGVLPAKSISALLAAPDDGLWIGYEKGGASFLKSGKVINYSERDGFPVSQVRSFARDEDGNVWAAVKGGFARLGADGWRRVHAEWNYPNRSARALLLDRQGTLWVAGETQIFFLPRGARKFQALEITTGVVPTLAQAPDGTIYFYDHGQHATRCFRPPLDPRAGALPRIRIEANSLLVDRDGSLWLAGTGLFRISSPDRLLEKTVRPSSPGVEKITKAQGISSDDVNVLFEDREGNIWVGTGAGLDRFRHRNLSWFPLQPTADNISLVAADNGKVLAGSNGYKTLPMVLLPDETAMPGSQQFVITTYRAPNGTIWISAFDKLMRWQKGAFVGIPPPEQIKKILQTPKRKQPMVVSSITTDSIGALWVSIGGCGEFQLSNGVWRFVTVLKQHPDWAANFAYTDGEGRIWFSFGDQIAGIDHGKTRSFSATDGLTVGPFNVVAGLGNVIWVGGESGLAFLQGDRFHTVEADDGTDFGPVKGIVIKPDGGVWLNSGPGIIHIPEKEVRHVLQRADYRVRYDLYDVVTDLPEPLERSEVYASGAIEATDGTLWFPTLGGVVRVDPVYIYKNPLPPPVSIRSIVADGRSYSPYAPASLPPLIKNLRIDYTALNLSIPERVRFRFKMDGVDTGWQDVGARRQAFYTKLRPGQYRFHVIACNNDGVWNETGATLDFTIAPAWYQTIWFLTVCIIAGMLGLWAIHRLRVAAISKAMNARFNERLAERTRIARELHDTLLQTIHGSKLVADNALDGIDDRGQMRGAMKQLSVWLGQAVEEGRAALNSLRTSTVQKNDLAEALKRVTENGFVPKTMAVTVSVNGEAREMHAIARDEVYRIAYEAIHNACVHSHATRVLVELTYAEDLKVRVNDNGVGIDPLIVQEGRKEHFGLQGMRERAERIKGKLTIASSAESGTTITLVVPGRMIFQKTPATDHTPASEEE
jgi:signal transduction histidine kinase/ligand-binding sensor domain-containing protein